MTSELARVSCPFCSTAGDLDTTCPTCQTAHHAECWAAAGGCANNRCSSRLTRIDTPPQGLPVIIEAEIVRDGDEQPSRRMPLWGWIAIGVAVAAIIGVVLMLTVFASEPEAEPTPVPTVPPIVVPQVTGLPFPAAREELLALGLQVLFEERVTDAEDEGVVLEQSIPPLSEAASGDGISLVVADAPAPTPTPTPTPAPDGAPSDGASPPTAPASPTDPVPTPTATPVTASGPVLDPPIVAIVESPRDRTRAEQFVEEYTQRGYDAQILASDDYPQWQPGVFVVYVQSFEDRETAIQYCQEEFGTYPRGCYVLDTRAR